jgi:hypothetical protein
MNIFKTRLGEEAHLMLEVLSPFHFEEMSSAIKKTFYAQNVIITMFS